MGASWSLGPSAVAAFIVFIGVLIFVHELGHFLAAKYFNIKVLKFSLGFGPPLLSFRRGETRYQVALVPLGGFVKMVGDSPLDEIAPEDRDRSFTTAPIYQRAIIALAGPIFNLVFPILCFFAYNLLGPTVIPPIVGQVEIGRPAERAGLKRGDRVVSVNGQHVFSFGPFGADRLPHMLPNMVDLIGSRPGQELALEVQRDGKRVEIRVTPFSSQDEDVYFGSPETRGRIGVIHGREATRVGVDDPARNAAGFRTGDLVLAVDGRRVEHLDELEKAVRESGGRTVKFVVSRPSPLAAGDLILASGDAPVALDVAVPNGAAGLDALGLAPSDTFLRGIYPGGPADRAGLRPGDRLVKAGGRPVTSFASFVNEIAGQKAVELTVRREGREIELTIVAEEETRKHYSTGKERVYYDHGLGLGELRDGGTAHWSSRTDEELEKVELTIGEAFVLGVRQTAGVIGMVTAGIYKLFSREVSVETVGGPIMLFQVAAQAAEAGVFTYLYFLAVISVNLGLINLLPVPIFDGGHLLFCAIEAIKRRPMSLRAREAASMVGLVLLIALIVLAIRNDILRLDVF